jgi:RNA polymerase sigma factor
MDFIRKENKYKKDVPIESMSNFEDKKPLEEAVILKEEVFAFRHKLSQFGLTVDDLVEGAPRRAKTLSKVTRIGREASKDETIATKLYSTKKLPMAMILKVVKTTKKVLKTYRDFIVAVIIVYTENYEVIRQYLIKEER